VILTKSQRPVFFLTERQRRRSNSDERPNSKLILPFFLPEIM